MKDEEMMFHHLGIACRDLNKSKAIYQKIGYKQVSDIFEDYNQGIRGCFLEGPGPRLELIENLENSQTVTNFTKNGDMIYHQGFYVSESFSLENFLKMNRAILIKKPMDSTYFKQQICFVMLRNNTILEFIGQLN